MRMLRGWQDRKSKRVDHELSVQTEDRAGGQEKGQ